MERDNEIVQVHRMARTGCAEPGQVRTYWHRCVPLRPPVPCTMSGSTCLCASPCDFTVCGPDRNSLQDNLHGECDACPFHDALSRLRQAGPRFGTVASTPPWSACSDQLPCVLLWPAAGLSLANGSTPVALLALHLYTGLVLWPHLC